MKPSKNRIRLLKRQRNQRKHPVTCVCKDCAIQTLPKRMLESIDRIRSSRPKLPPCRVCGTLPRLEVLTIDVCAKCFAQEQHNIQAAYQRKQGLKGIILKTDKYEKKLLKLRRVLIDLPFEPIPVWYLLMKYFGKGRYPRNGKGEYKITREQHDFVINKLSGLAIIHKRNGETYCCKYRAKSLNLKKIRKTLEWRRSVSVVQPDGLNSSEDKEVKTNSYPTEPEDHPEGSSERDELVGSDCENCEPEEFDEPSVPLTKHQKKKKRKKNLSSTHPNLEKNESEGRDNSRRKKRKIKVETVQAEDTSTSTRADVEIIELEEPYTTPVPANAGITVELREPNNESEIEFVTTTAVIKPDPEKSDELSVPGMKLKKKKRKKNNDETNVVPANNISENSFAPEDGLSRPTLRQQSPISSLNEADGKTVTKAKADSVPKRRSLWSILQEELDDEELPSTNGNPNTSPNKSESAARKVVVGVPKSPSPSKSRPRSTNRCIDDTSAVSGPNDTGRTESHSMEALDVPDDSRFAIPSSLCQVDRLGVPNDGREKDVSQPPPSDSSSDSDVENILTPIKRKAYSANALLDDSDEETLRSSKRRKRSGYKPGPASRKIACPASRKVPIAVEVEKPQNSSTPTPSPPSYRRVKKSTRRTRKVPRSYAETSDSDSDFVITSSSSENDSNSSYDSDASSVTCSSLSDISNDNDSDGSSVLCISDPDRDDTDEDDDEVEIQSVSEDDEEVREAVSAARDPRFHPVVVLEHNSDLEAKLKAKKITSQEWMNLEREREDYEEQFLGSLKFSQTSLDYAIDVIIKALNWDVFPFGAKVLNQGRITKRQKKNPNGEEWLQIKQEFIIRHFKTALSITPWRRKWYCCKNRVDTLDIKEYLERFWKIEL